MELFVLWLIHIFLPEKKSQARQTRNYDYDTSSLLITDSLLRDRGCPKTFNEPVEKDPFLNNEYDDGPDW